MLGAPDEHTILVGPENLIIIFDQPGPARPSDIQKLVTKGSGGGGGSSVNGDTQASSSTVCVTNDWVEYFVLYLYSTLLSVCVQ